MAPLSFRRLRPLGWLVAVVVVATACGDRASASDIHAPVPTLEPTSVPVVQAARPAMADATSPAQLDDAEVRAYFEDFEDVRARVVFGDAGIGELERWALPRVITGAIAERDANLALIEADDPMAVVGSNTFENVLGLAWLDERLAAFTSCSERHDERMGGDLAISFVDHRIVVDTSPDPWRVVEREVRHDSSVDEGLACVAPTFVERSLAAVDVALPAADVALADPASTVAGGLHDVFGGRIEEELTQIIAMQAEAGTRRVSERRFRSEVIGLDPAQPDFMVVVSVCSYYPDGIVDESLETGERTRVDGYGPGSSEEDWIYVWLEPIRYGGATVAGIEPGVNQDCWSAQ